MRRRVIIASLVAVALLGIGLVAFLRPPTPAGKFPAEFSDVEKRQIVAAAHSDALRQTFASLRRGRWGEARRWVVNSRKQTVRSIGQQGEGKIWVAFGVDDPAATDGYAIWARYILKKEKDRWVMDKPLF
jgi:hypothetical protein